jgi:glycosyltransferase involved in cell wall biosynthesis
MNSPDLKRFSPDRHPRRAFMADGVLRLVYAGAITPTYELDVVLRAVAEIRHKRPTLKVALTLYGRGDAEGSLKELARELQIAAAVEMPGRIPIDAVPAAIAASDIGIAATRLDSYSEVSLSTKVLEYGAMEKPVVATKLPTVEFYFGQDTLSLYQPGDSSSMAKAILHLVDDAADRDARVERTAKRVDELGWAHQAEAYQAVVSKLAKPRSGKK